MKLQAVDRLSLPVVVRLVFSSLRAGVDPTWSRPTIGYCDATRAGLLGGRILARIGVISISWISHSVENMKAEDGAWAAQQTWTWDSVRLSEHALEVVKRHPLVALMGERFDSHRILLYLRKACAEEMTPLITQVKAADWWRRQSGQRDQEMELFLERSFWATEIESFARERDIHVVWYTRSLRVQGFDLSRISTMMHRVFRRAWRVLKRRMTGHQMDPKLSTESSVAFAPLTSPPIVGMHYSGKGLTLDPSLNSDLFWFPFIKDGSDVQIQFARSDDPLDAEKLAFCETHGIRPIAISSDSTRCEGVPVWTSEGSWRLRLELSRWLIRSALCHLIPDVKTASWVFGLAWQFIKHYSYWRRFFEDTGIRVYLSFIDWTPDRLAADQAFDEMGGISVCYQRSTAPYPKVKWACNLPVHFVFSEAQVPLELLSGSRIDQYVIAGYLHDHAFEAVRDRSDDLRRKLQAAGAEFIVCYFDEGASTNPREQLTYEYCAENHAFLLTRLLEDPTLGLILKPKKPSMLRTILGKHVKLLDRALETGRCVLFEDGVVSTPVLPCEPGLAADVSIGLLLGATAIVETHLAGGKSLLLDREGLLDHPFRQGTAENLVFESWEALWSSVADLRRDPSGSDIGNWGDLTSRIDPFRDGRAAERIGTYIGSLIDGFHLGLPREAVLDRAAHEYVSEWGQNNVLGRGGDPLISKRIPKEDSDTLVLDSTITSCLVESASKGDQLATALR